jgi:uncharacterized protein (DUF2235 family)
MKRIAIFCDGTWSEADAKHPTNVYMLSREVAAVASGNIKQEVLYFAGVGTGRGPDWLSQKIDKIGGGAFGWGLMANVVEAYESLAKIYRPGDHIYIFGFSRGAFTARSLAGLIRSSNIPPKDGLEQVDAAVKRYKSKDATTHPRADESFAYRYSVNPALITEPRENDWRRKNKLPEGTLISTRYIGVWDTVGALGIPSIFGDLAKLWNSKYQFHDTDLSSSIHAARHAVSVDEKRRTFVPTLWQNLPRLNKGLSQSNHRYLEQWFAGDHNSVGGGGDIKGLSNSAFLWIAEGAEKDGLDFRPGVMPHYRKGVDVQASLYADVDYKTNFFKRLAGLGERDREGPIDMNDVSKAAQDRWATANPPYRPVPLNCVAAQMKPLGGRAGCDCTSKCKRLSAKEALSP